MSLREECDRHSEETNKTRTAREVKRYVDDIADTTGCTFLHTYAVACLGAVRTRTRWTLKRLPPVREEDNKPRLKMFAGARITADGRGRRAPHTVSDTARRLSDGSPRRRRHAARRFSVQTHASTAPDRHHHPVFRLR